MAIKIPNVIIILDKEWHIIIQSDLKHKGDPCYGLCEYENRNIYLDKSIKGELLSITFQHEVCHAACYELGLKLPPRKEEKLADGLSKIFHQLFKISLK